MLTQSLRGLPASKFTHGIVSIVRENGKDFIAEQNAHLDVGEQSESRGVMTTRDSKIECICAEL